MALACLPLEVVTVEGKSQVCCQDLRGSELGWDEQDECSNAPRFLPFPWETWGITGFELLPSRAFWTCGRTGVPAEMCEDMCVLMAPKYSSCSSLLLTCQVTPHSPRLCQAVGITHFHD